ncbi:Uncharacterised protein [Actinobaculum suis]|uniref:Uncharacterized protein n=1 Tax=Actinobaculum suis TaxID=1657 RepID=A0A0K9ESQ0_9ACTO|nr:hypothetical protein [Actinobaculum suis]KMY23214.1 hypothetical protein ACU19_05595 [Actinobaculum suis]VDG75422.1 Uncharacterised protein [Actinobaculum suis]
MVRVVVNYHGVMAELAGIRDEIIELPARLSLAQLRAELRPGNTEVFSRALESATVSVDGETVTENEEIQLSDFSVIDVRNFPRRRPRA